MSFALKYIVLKKEDGQEVGFTFSTDITHADFLEGVRATPLGFWQSRGKAYKRALRDAECVGGGFIGPAGCNGNSESIGVKSRGYADTKAIYGSQYADFVHQVAGPRTYSGPIDANVLEKMAQERPDDCFLKGSGVQKLISAIRHLEAQVRRISSSSHTEQSEDARLEAIAASYDGCLMDGSGFRFDVGAALRLEFAKLATTSLEALMVAHRLSIVPEYEGQWHAHVYGVAAEPTAYGTGETPLLAVRAAIAQQYAGSVALPDNPAEPVVA